LAAAAGTYQGAARIRSKDGGSVPVHIVLTRDESVLHRYTLSLVFSVDA
jgi:hypothetical protein